MMSSSNRPTATCRALVEAAHSLRRTYASRLDQGGCTVDDSLVRGLIPVFLIVMVVLQVAMLSAVLLI